MKELIGKAEKERSAKQIEIQLIEPHPLAGLLSLAISVGMIVWSFSSCGTGTEGGFLWGFTLFVMASVLFVEGIKMFYDRRPKPAASGDKSDSNLSTPSPISSPQIKCLECGKEISTQATACPHCGCPLGPGPPSPQLQKPGGDV